MTQSQRFINIYYDFSERCGDDFEIMTRVFKFCGCKKRPNVIQSQLEEIDAEKSFCDEYLQMMSDISDDLINRAKSSVIFDRYKEKLKEICEYNYKPPRSPKAPPSIYIAKPLYGIQ